MPFLYPRLTIKKHTYYIRVQVPEHLRFIAKKRTIIYSLGTKDYFEALYRVREESYKVDLLIKFYEKQFEEMSLTDNKQIFLSEDDYKLILINRWIKLLKDLAKYEKDIKSGKKSFKDFSFYQPDELDDRERIELIEQETADGNIIITQKPVIDIWDGYKEREPNDDVSYNPSIESMEAQLHRYVLSFLKKWDNPLTSAQTAEILNENPSVLPFYVLKKKKIKKNNYDFGGIAFGTTNFFNLMRESELALFNMIQNIKDGEKHDIPLNISVIIGAARKHIEEKLLKSSITPDDIDYDKLLKKWNEERLLKKVSPKTITADKRMISIVLQLIKNKKISSFIKKDIKELEIQLLKLPENFSKKYPNKPILDIINETKDLDVTRLSHSTVRNYIRSFGNFCSFLEVENIISRNPFVNYTFMVAVKKKQSYLPFTDEDLQKIFNPKTYPLRVIENVTTKEAAIFWVPLIALFYGARLNEICQLDISDINTHAGIPCISLINGEDKHIKKDNKRLLPIPQKIIDLGFLTYIENRRKAGAKKVFALTYNKSNGYGDSVGKYFARYKEKIGVIGEHKVFHSFRHLLPQSIADLELPERYAQEIGGWSKNENTGISPYKNGDLSLLKLKRAIDSMTFPTVDFDALKNRTIDDLELKPSKFYRVSTIKLKR